MKPSIFSPKKKRKKEKKERRNYEAFKCETVIINWAYILLVEIRKGSNIGLSWPRVSA